MVEGHLTMGVGKFEYNPDFDNFSEDQWLFQGAGRANVDFGGFNLEVETGGASVFDNGSSWSSMGAAAHLWGRFNNAALGVYGAVNFPSGWSIYTAGVEGEAYLGAVTLGAAADYNSVDESICGGCLADSFWTARGWADLYVTPDARVGAEVSYLSNNYWDARVWGAKVDAEYRFSGTPFSVWAEGNYVSLDFTCCGETGDLWSGLFGFRVLLDGNRTLHQHDMDVPWDGGTLDATGLDKWFWAEVF